MNSPQRWPRLVLLVILLAYVAAAAQFALLTPPWQAPDEPAHFNYARFVAERGALPVLRPGDFPLEYVQRFTDPAQTPQMSIDPIRYESWQPPLYYLLAAGIYRLVLSSPLHRQLLALRLFSVVLGALLLLLAYRVLSTLAPDRPWLALGATAFVASLPMHVATTAAVSNDTLAEIWVALLLWQMLLLLREPDRGPRAWALLGATLGLGALTKLSTLTALPLAVAVLGFAAWRQGAGRGRWLLSRSLVLLLPPLLLLAPWVARNMTVYGFGDPLIFARHAQVAGRQLRTADWVQEVGLRHALADFVLTTFHSFWGQFGWMGVPIDERLYRLCAVFAGLAVLGLLLRLPRLRRDWSRLPLEQQAGLLLFGGLALLTAASFLWYNLTFLQRQGRYLFPALIPLGAFLAIGWREVTRRSRRALVAVLLGLLALLIAGRSALGAGPWDKWTLAGLLGLAGGVGLGARAPERLARWLYALPYPLLLAFDLVCLYLAVLPALS